MQHNLGDTERGTMKKYHTTSLKALHSNSFIHLNHTTQSAGRDNNLYQVSRQLFIPVIRQFILKNRSEPPSAGQPT